jgi:predicted DNA-binding transcriptional regulator AlpA
MPPKDKSVNAALAAHARSSNAPAPKFATDRKPKRGDSIIYKPFVLERSGLSYSNVWSMMLEGTFPRSIKVGNKIGWYASEFEEWLTSRPRSRLKGDKAL